MKKIIACLMACFAVFAFAACSLNKSGTIPRGKNL